MELIELGFNEWFNNRLGESGVIGCQLARITSADRGGYLVRNENGEAFSELAGEFVFSAESKLSYPVVGDWVLVQYHNDNKLAIIHRLLPRKTTLKRKAAGKKVGYQIIASNIDVAFIVQSCDFDFNIRRLERYLVMVNNGHIKPVVLLSKADMVDLMTIDSRVSEIKEVGINCEIIAYSIKNGLGLPQINQAIQPGMTYCLIGSSGVGKTTLLNNLIGRDAFKTNTVRAYDGKGKHTTTRRHLVVLDQGAMIIDTPGMRELGNIGVKAGIEDIFSDITGLAANCRFRDCTHTNEAGCAVLKAVQDGSLNEIQYSDYLKLIKESEHYQLSYAEQRKKDKKFGQFIKSAKKQIRKGD
ncbi:ribosome small subunit-dependent GTPase A [Chloroflexota bacterium]